MHIFKRQGRTVYGGQSISIASMCEVSLFDKGQVHFILQIASVDRFKVALKKALFYNESPH